MRPGPAPDEHWASRVQLLARDLLFGRHQPFSAAKVDVNGPHLDPVHHPAGQLALVLRHVAQRLVPLEVVNVAQHCVLGGLGSEALEVFGREHLDHLAAVTPHDAAAHLKATGLGVELDCDVAGRIEGTRVCDRQRTLHGVQHLLERNAHLGAERGQRVGEAFGGGFRLRPRACPRQRHSMRCASRPVRALALLALALRCRRHPRLPADPRRRCP